MGRLFWKFFFVFMLAQVVTLVGVSTAFWLRHRDPSPGPDLPPRPVAAVTLDAAAATLTHAGEAGLQSLLNVVRNAARHTAAGGGIRIVGRPDDPAREIRVELTDEGPGVPESELQSIFEPFFRGAAAGGSSGHGLGLAIARRVVEAHGGCIAASNREGSGLVVTIRLPA